MSWLQKTITLSPKPRGFHIITHELLGQLPELKDYKVGIAHIFICHTSASLTLNEHVSLDVLTDFESSFNNLVRENEPYYIHTLEGSDDMPAHIKSSLLGASVTVPVTNGRLNLGTWQGVYLCEHRNRGGSRSLIITINGDTDV